MSIQSIKMPDIGEGIAEVEVVAWRVAVGDVVAEDQILADVMTDKATVEIPSHVAGTVVSLDASVGQVVAVGTPIIHIQTAAAQEVSTPAAILRETSAAATAKAAPPQTHPARLATPELAPAVVRPRAAAPAPNHVDRPIAAPAVRRRAWELGLDLAGITPTGTAGRISHADLDRHLERSEKKPELRPAGKGYQPLEATEVVPVIGLRRKIAQKMQEAKRRIPHFTYVEEIDVTELEDLRAQLNNQHAQQRGRLTLLPFLIRAMVLAVREHPTVNARYDDDAGLLTRFAAVHLGLATQTDGGLMVPVIRHAEALDLWACAAEISRLAEAARTGKVTREELTGSTLTVTSLGALGGMVSTPVINHPDVAIVGTNRIVERPMIKNGMLVARKMMNLSSSFDHRVVDGLHAAEFVQRVRSYLEYPGTMLID